MVATTQTQQGRPSGAQSGGAQTTQAGAGNAGAEAHAGGEAAANDRASEAVQWWQTVETGLDATPFASAAVVTACAGLIRTDPAQAGSVYNSPGIMGKMHAKLSGDELYQCLEQIRVPARGAGRVAAWLDHLRQATTPASVATFQGIIGAADPGDLVSLLDPSRDTLLTIVLNRLAPIDPLTVFANQQTELYAGACNSATFVGTMVEHSAPSAIWRAISGTPTPRLGMLAGHLNNEPTGWSWLDSLNPSGLTPAEHARLGEMAPTANGPAQAKITTINATAGERTLAVAFAASVQAPQAATPPPTAQALRALLQTGTHAERSALFGDTTKAAFIFGLLTGNPFAQLSIGPAERAQYLLQDAFFVRILTDATMAWTERVEHLTNRAYINSLAPRFATNDAAVANFIITVWPALANISNVLELDLRAITLVTTAPGIAAAILAKFDDRVSYSNHQGPSVGRPLDPEGTTQTPMQRIDALLVQAPAPADLGHQLVSMVGALGGMRLSLSGDAAKMTSIQNKVSNDQEWFDIVVALEMPLTASLTRMRAKGANAARLQQLITQSPPEQRPVTLTIDDNVNLVKGFLPDDCSTSTTSVHRRQLLLTNACQ